MINVILEYTGDISAVSELLGFEYAEVFEMLDNTYCLILQDPDELDAIELEMESGGVDIFIVGAFNFDGTPYLYGGNASDMAKRNYDVGKYAARLRAKKEFDSNGNIISETPYTEAEAKGVQVMKYYGWGDRVLE